VVLPTWVIVALPDTTFPSSGWLVALKAVTHAGVTHGAPACTDGAAACESGATACAGGEAACASGVSASEIAAAIKSRLPIDRARPDLARPDFPRPLAVSATGTQALRTSLQMSR
jgi:hypothetical protein